jgi:hypothetical protein
LFHKTEIRQEQVKAALAMCSNQKQSVILASKRNTTYMISSGNGVESQNGENPFPVPSHLNGVMTAGINNENEPPSVRTGSASASTPSAKPSSSSAAPTATYSDEDTSDEELNNYMENNYDLNSDLESTKRSERPTAPLSAIQHYHQQQQQQQTVFQAQVSANSSNPNLDNSGTFNTSSSGSSVNFHSNQYYHNYQSQLSSQQQTQLVQSDLNRSNYIPHQKTDRVVTINKNVANGKNAQKMQQQQQHQQSKTKQNEISTNNIRNGTSNSESNGKSGIKQQINNSPSSIFNSSDSNGNNAFLFYFL